MKHKTRTKALSWLLSLALMLSLVPGLSMTAMADSEVSYQEGSWSNNSVAFTAKTAANPTTLASGTTAWGDGNWYVVPAGGVTISSRITVTGTVNLILTDGNTLTASKGITVADGNTLNIYAQSEGNNAGVLLINSVDDYNSGIGGGTTANDRNAGALIIHGGKIVASGGQYGAGIGGGYMGNGGIVTIYGGAITAAGGRRAAGIGGGEQYNSTGGNGGEVTIFGGTVTATGGYNGAGIGGGNVGSGGTVTIHGGTVTATGNTTADGGAGIGAGNSGSGGTVTIDGGTVTATGANIKCMGIGGIAQMGNWKEVDGQMVREITPPQNGSLTVGSGLKVYGGNSANPTTEISQDEMDKIKSSQNTTVYQYMIVSGPLHEHSFTYSVNGDTITATCGADGCPLTDAKATLTIAAPQHTAVGDDKSADAQITDANNIKGDAAVSYYATNASSNKTGDALTVAPTAAGTYWAEITLGSATAHVVYTITDLAYTVTISDNLVGGTVAADKTSAKFGETVTLTITPDNGFTIKTVKYNDTAITANGGVYSFTMPAANVTVSAEFEGEPFDVTISNAITGGTVAVSSALDNGKARAGSEVTLTVTPATGYQIGTVKYNETTITPSNGVYKFTMPTEAVTVSATFVGKNTTVNLNNVTGGSSTCTASLLDSNYKQVTSLTKKAGEEFILSIDKDETHSYKVSFSPDAAVSMRGFSKGEYQAYINSTKSESLNTYLYWVTMPGVNADTVNMTVTFATAKTFTILYQPTPGSNPEQVWVKFGYTESNEDKLVTAKMSKDAAMGNAAVWSLKMSAAFNPNKIAFATSESLAESANTEAATVSENSSWSNITGGQYLIVGNNAKTVIAAFTGDSDSANVDREATVISIGDNAEYQIAICASGGSGSVTTPAAPTKAGYDFVAWRGYEGITAKDYAANTQISVNENMAFSAVWRPSNPKVKLNLNGGTGIDTTLTVAYNTTLPSLTPAKSGYSFAGWSVAKDVTEDGKVYTNGAPFDTGTKITADLELTAQWKHVHAYGCVQIEAVRSLATKYAAYAPYLHIKICGCGDVDLEAHSLNSDGVCACGYSKSGATPTIATLDISYGQWLNGNYTQKMAEVPEDFAVNSEVSVSAPGKWGNLTFSKWQYKAEGDAGWTDAGAYKMMSFVIPGNMEMRALYVNATTVPEVSMSATTYATTAANMDGEFNSILFQMNYKLPDGYTYVDAGVRSGDNAGISYYELKERTATMDAEAKAITYSLAAAMSVLQGQVTTFDTSGTEQYYAKRENSVLDESGMTEAKLGEYMYQSKPINIKDPPLYWNYKPTVTGQSGSINALTPVGFAQRNNGDHYIYAIAYLTYKDSSGTTHTIYTPALATTLNGSSSAGTVSKSGS